MKKKQIVFVVIAVAAIATAGFFTVRSMAAEKAAKRDLQYTYDRAYGDLRDCVNNLATTLDKSIYANTPTQQNGLATRLMRETSLAKGALATLPIDDTTMNNVSKYITQVGDFSMSLSDRISAGGKITDAEYKTMQELKTYASKLSENLANITPNYSANLSQQFKEVAEDFTDFPSLIYDGPFSDHIGRKAPRMLSGKTEVSENSARQTAAQFLGVDAKKLSHAPDTGGTFPRYNFIMGNTRISVSKKGGIVVSMESNRDVTSEKIDPKTAEQKALAFLNAHGFSNMQSTYWVKMDGRYLLNFAYESDKVRCYPDLVKVSVAVDNGEVVALNANGYVMNHTSRSFEEPKFSQQQAQAKVSPHLKVNSGRLALIPTEGLNEVLCWEFNCTGAQNDRVLVYINCKTGMEQQILIVRPSDTGTLVK